MRWVCVVCLFSFVILTQAQECNKTTDAQQDDLSGPVASVFTKTKWSGVRWQQPGGPTLLIPIWCAVCEYDRDGVRTKTGQVLNGAFVGQTIEFIRDDQGRVTDHLVVNTSGKLDSHEVIGPLGKTEETDYINGKISLHQTYSYDRHGCITSQESFDGSGKRENKFLITRRPDGTFTGRSDWGENGQLSSKHSFDPETATEHFTTFDESGMVKLTFTVVEGKLASFWELPNSPSQYGDNFTETDENGDRVNYACNSTSKCDVSHVHYEYLAPQEKRNPLSAEWRDSEGSLRYAVYYEYETDSFRNWTHRQVWVWSSGMAERKLYENDSREITYWEQ